MVDPTNLQASGVMHPAAWADLAEHTGTLVTILGALVILVLAILGGIWKIGTKLIFAFKDDVFKLINKIDEKIDIHLDEQDKYALRSTIEPEIKQLYDRQYELRTTILPTFQKKEDMVTWGQIMKQGFADMKDRIDALSKRIK